MAKGQRPGPGDDALASSAENLTPDKSLERIESHAKYLFSTVTIFGTLLTGFQLYSNNPAIKNDPEAIAIPLSLVCASLAVAMVAMTPWGGNVDLNNLLDVKRYMNARLFWRGIAIFLSGLLFAAAIASIPWVLSKKEKKEEPAPGAHTSLSLTVSRGEEADVVKATTKLTAIPKGGTVDIEASGVRPDGTTVVLMRHQSKRPDGGEMELEVGVPKGEVLRQVTVTTRVKRADGRVAEEKASLDIEPRPAKKEEKPKTPKKK